MSKCDKRRPEMACRVPEKAGARRAVYCLLIFCLLFAGCRQDMQDQPRYEVYESSGFFKDGLSSRQPVEGTVARGYLRSDKALFTGQKSILQGGATTAPAQTGSAASNASATSSGSAPAPSAAAGQGSTPQSEADMQQQPAGEPNDVEEFPFAITEQVMERGRERFQIFCAMCHGYTGDGDGMIVRRGFRQPPSYHERRLREAKVGYLFRVITEGFGAMPSYKSQVPVQDRWAIIAYMRALQLSKMNQQQAVESPAEPGKEPGGHK